MLRRLLAAAVAATCLSAAQAAPALAAGGGVETGCTDGGSVIGTCSSGYVTVYVSEDVKDGVQFTLAQDASGDVVAICKSGSTQVGCINKFWTSAHPIATDPQPLHPNDGWWSTARNCWMFETNALPTDSTFQTASGGATTGKVYACQKPATTVGVTTFFVWAEDPPEPAEGVFIELTARAVKSLNLKGVEVGMTPPVVATDPNSIGLVGAPNWLWVKNPAPQTWGPASGSSSSNNLTVSVTAKAQKVTWNLGDGSAPIVCTAAGTPWQPGYGVQPSPDCGRAAGYQQSGTYPVTAKSHWIIDWTSNMGKAGRVAMDLDTATTVTIAEVQVINR